MTSVGIIIIVGFTMIGSLSQVTCPIGGATYSSSTNKCYALTTGTFTGSNVNAACSALHAAAVPATFPGSNEANAVIEDSCNGLANGQSFYTGYYLPDGVTDCSGGGGWQFRNGDSASYMKQLFGGVWFWTFMQCPDQSSSCAKKCVRASNSKICNVACSTSFKVCCQLPPVPSPSSSITPSSSVTPTQTPSGSRTASRTPSSSQTSSRTRSASITASRTGTQTRTSSATVSRTMSPSRSESSTRTPTSTGTGTMSSTATLTMSKSGTGTTTATHSMTMSVSATQTQSRSATPTWTSTGSVTATTTGTGTQTSTQSNTQTMTRSASATWTATRTVSATATVTRSASPTSTPYPMLVHSVDQSITVIEGNEVGLIGLSGQGFRLTEAGAVPQLETPAFAFWNITVVSPTYIRAMMPMTAYHWLNVEVTLRVLTSSTTFTKPNMMPSPQSMQLTPSVLPFGSFLTVTAPYIGGLVGASLTMTSPDSLTISCSNIRALNTHALSCQPVNVPERMFNVSCSFAFNHPKNIGALRLPGTVAVTINKPSLTYVSARRKPSRVDERVHMMASSLAGLSTSNSLVQYIPSNATKLSETFVSATSLSHFAPSTPATLSISNRTLTVASVPGANVRTAAPVLSRISPAFIQLPAEMENNAILSFSFEGSGFGDPTQPRIQMISINNASCAVTVVTNEELMCEVPFDDVIEHLPATNASHVRMPVVMQWGTVSSHRTDEVAAVTLHRKPVIARVLPGIITPEAVVVLSGSNFLASNCIGCVFTTTPTVFIGGVACTATNVLSNEIATCVAPAVPLSLPGYPRLPVSFVNRAGQHAPAENIVSYNAEVTLEWESTWNGTICALPSGPSTVLPFAIVPQLRVAGSGNVRCSLLSTDTTSGANVLFVGGNIKTAQVGSETTVEILPFYAVGVRAASNQTATLVGQCTTDEGVRLTTNTSLMYNTPAWSLEWVTPPAASYAYSPANSINASAALNIRGCGDVGAISTQQLTAYMSCYAGIVPGMNAADVQTDLTIRSLLSISTVITQGVIKPVSNGTWNVTFPALSLQSFDLGARLQFIALCEWTPTSEPLHLPSVNIGLGDMSVVWQGCSGFLGCSNQSDGLHAYAFPGVRYPSSIRVQHTVNNDNGHGNDAMTCSIVMSTSTGLGLGSTGDRSIETALLPSLTWNVTLSITGSEGVLSLTVECAVWNRKVRSGLLLIHPLEMVITPATAVPKFAIFSTSRIPSTKLLPMQFHVLDGLGRAVEDATCVIESLLDGMKVVSAVDGSAITDLQPDNGHLNISNAVIIAETTSAAGSAVSVAVTCLVDGMERAGSYTWDIFKLSLALELPSASSSLTTDANGAIPVVQTRFTPEMESEDALDAWSALLQDGVFRSSVSCRATATALAAEQTVFLNRPTAELNANGLAVYDRMTLLGRRGGYFNVSAACSIDWLSLSANPVYFTVHSQPCAAGAQPSGILCEECPVGTFTLGRNEERCIECPKLGALCTSGILRLLPGYFRPPEHSNFAFGPETELHLCFNEVACMINATTLSYSCREGYTGPLCGVCDENDGYGAFGRYCERCWPEEASQALLAVLIIAFVGLLAFIGFRQTQTKKGRAAILLRITMGHVQALGSISALKASVAANFGAVLGWSDSVSDSPFMSGPAQCVLRLPLLSRYIGTILIPVAAFVGVISVVALVYAVRACIPKHLVWDRTTFTTKFRDWFQHRRHISALGFFALLMYMPIMKLSINVLGCTEEAIAGLYYVRMDLLAECGNATHTFLRVLAVVVIIGFGIGFPVGLWYTLTRASSESRVVSALSFLYDGYRTGKEKPTRPTKLIWWETIVLIRKAGFIVVSVLITNAFYQVVFSMLWVVLFLVVHQHYQPYVVPLFNVMETMSLGVLFVTATVAGMMLRVALDSTFTGVVGDGNNALAAITTLTMVLNVAFAIILALSIAIVFVKDLLASPGVPQLVAKATFRKLSVVRANASATKVITAQAAEKTMPVLDARLTRSAEKNGSGSGRTAMGKLMRNHFEAVAVDFVNPLRDPAKAHLTGVLPQRNRALSVPPGASSVVRDSAAVAAAHLPFKLDVRTKSTTRMVTNRLDAKR